MNGDRGVSVFGTKGASVHVRELTRALTALGHDVRVVSSRVDGSRPRGYDVPVQELRDGLEPPEGFVPDVVYERYSLRGTAGLRLARALDVPLVLEVNAPLPLEAARYRGLADGEALAADGELLRAADRLVAVSTGVAEWLCQLGVEPARVVVVRNGVDPARFGTEKPERPGLRRPLVGFVGSLKPWHDVDTLVAALGRFPQTDRPHLLVVGDGPERARLARTAADGGVVATFAGAVAHEDVPGLLASVDVAVVPYAADERFYFSPLKLMEALAAARPVVASAVGDVGHCVRDGETGRLCAPGDAEALAGAIADTLGDPARANAMANAGRRHVLADHTWEQNAAAVIRLAAGAAAVGV